MWRPVNIYIPEIIHSTTFLVLPVYSVVAFSSFLTMALVTFI